MSDSKFATLNLSGGLCEFLRKTSKQQDNIQVTIYAPDLALPPQTEIVWSAGHLQNRFALNPECVEIFEPFEHAITIWFKKCWLADTGSTITISNIHQFKDDQGVDSYKFSVSVQSGQVTLPSALTVTVHQHQEQDSSQGDLGGKLVTRTLKPADIKIMTKDLVRICDSLTSCDILGTGTFINNAINNATPNISTAIWVDSAAVCIGSAITKLSLLPLSNPENPNSVIFSSFNNIPKEILQLLKKLKKSSLYAGFAGDGIASSKWVDFFRHRQLIGRITTNHFMRIWTEDGDLFILVGSETIDKPVAQQIIDVYSLIDQGSQEPIFAIQEPQELMSVLRFLQAQMFSTAILRIESDEVAIIEHNSRKSAITFEPIKIPIKTEPGCHGLEIGFTIPNWIHALRLWNKWGNGTVNLSASPALVKYFREQSRGYRLAEVPSKDVTYKLGHTLIMPIQCVP